VDELAVAPKKPCRTGQGLPMTSSKRWTLARSVGPHRALARWWRWRSGRGHPSPCSGGINRGCGNHPIDGGRHRSTRRIMIIGWIPAGSADRSRRGPSCRSPSTPQGRASRCGRPARSGRTATLHRPDSTHAEPTFSPSRNDPEGPDHVPHPLVRHRPGSHRDHTAAHVDARPPVRAGPPVTRPAVVVTAPAVTRLRRPAAALVPAG
jgi:hypothetical protein